MVASIIRTIFAQPDREHIEKQFTEVTTMLARSHPKVAGVTGLVDRAACAVSGARVASNRALARKNAIRAKFDRVRALIVLHSGDYKA